MARDGVDVRRAVGRGTERARRDDGVLERLARQDVGRLQVLPHHVDDALAGLVGHLAALAVRAGNGRAAGQRHAERLGHAVHRERRAHGVAMADAGGARRHHLDELLHVDAARRQLLAGVPDDGAGAREAAGEMAVQHRPARQHDRRNVDGGRAHDHRRRGLVAAGGQHDAVEEIAVEALDEAEIGKVAIERRGRALAGLLDRMDRKLDRECRRRRGCRRARGLRGRGDGGCRATGRCRSGRCR